MKKSNPRTSISNKKSSSGSAEKQTLKEFSETASFYKNVLDSLDDYCVFTTDKKGFIQSWNSGANNIFNYQPKEIVGKHAKILFTLEDRKARAPEKELSMALKTGRAINERWHVKKDKTVFWGSGLVFPLKDQQDNFIGFTKVMRDLTSNKKLLNEMQENEAFTADLFNSSSDIVLILDLNGKVIRINHQAKKTFRLTDYNYSEYNIFDFFASSDKLGIKTAISNAKKAKTGKFKASVNTGNAVWIQVTVTPIRSASGQIKQLLAIGHDISAEKEQEEERQRLMLLIKAERNKLNEIFEKAPGFLTVLRGKDHVFELANEAYYKLVGHRQLIGRPAAEAFPEIIEQGYIKLLDKVFKTSKPFVGKELPVTLQESAGAQPLTRYINLTYQAWKDPKGKIIGIFAHGYDVTEQVESRKLLEISRQELKQSEERLQQMADSMPQMVWTARQDGHLDYYNKRWYEYTGFDKSKRGEESWTPILHPDDVQFCKDTWNNSVRTGKRYEIEYRFKDPKNPGTYRWFLGRALPIKNRSGAIIKWIGTCTDIQEQKQLQSQKDDFLATASHELKTPVTSIKAYCQVMESQFTSKGFSKEATMLGKMNAQIDKLTNLIGDLLDVTKIQSGKLIFHETNFDFNDMVSEVVDDIQRTTTQHRIVTKLNNSKTVYADRDRIGQVLINFLTNAIKYSPGSKEIIVTTKKTGRNVILCVEDFGIGIHGDHQQEVFDRFYRVGGDMQHTYPGLGLGLFISAEIIKRQHGKIWVDSVPNKGSKFCFSIPADRRAKP